MNTDKLFKISAVFFIIIYGVIILNIFFIVSKPKPDITSQVTKRLVDIEKKLTHIENKIDNKTKDNSNTKPIKNRDEITCLSNVIEFIQPKLDIKLRRLIAKTILEVSKKHNIDPLLITALIYEESSFRPLVQSKAGAVGLMQIRFSVWKEHPILKNNGISAKDKLFWIENNINCGVKILKKYINEAKGDIVVALNRYHTGSTKLNAKRYEIKYVNNIMLRYYNLQQIWRIFRNEAD